MHIDTKSTYFVSESQNIYNKTSEWWKGRRSMAVISKNKKNKQTRTRVGR